MRRRPNTLLEFQTAMRMLQAWGHRNQERREHRELMRALADRPVPQQIRPAPTARPGWYWDDRSRLWWWWDGHRYTYVHPGIKQNAA